MAALSDTAYLRWRHERSLLVKDHETAAREGETYSERLFLSEVWQDLARECAARAADRVRHGGDAERLRLRLRFLDRRSDWLSERAAWHKKAAA